MLKIPSRLAIRSIPWAAYPFAFSILLVICLCGSHRYFGQIAGSSLSRTATINRGSFATPRDTADRLVEAVNGDCWRDEYECYAGAQQAKFTYQVMMSTSELSDSQDLSAGLAQVLQKFQFPLDLLERFQSKSLDLSNVSDPKVIQQKCQDFEAERQTRLKRWERDVQPLSIDWAPLIEQLQTLFVENFHRHVHVDHPSQSGIVHHLDCHVFGSVSNIVVNGTLADGSITALVSDPEVFQGNMSGGPGNGSAIMDAINYYFQKITRLDGRLKRSAERIEFVKEGGNWKIASVPFR